MKLVLTLNNYVKQTVQKVVQPLLLQNECKNFQINTTSWEFEKQWSEPNKEKWEELTKYKVEESQKRQTIPVHGKLKIQEKQIYLEVYIKYWNLREITKTDIEETIKMQTKYHQEKVMLSAEEGNKEVRYYSSKLLLGPFNKDKLTNRSQKATLNFGIHIQDLWIQSEEKQFKLYQNFRGLLTYLNEKQYKDSVNFLKSRNRQIKLEGQTSDRKNQDPRNWFNDTEVIEIQMEKERKEKMEEEYRKMEMK